MEIKNEKWDILRKLQRPGINPGSGLFLSLLSLLATMAVLKYFSLHSTHADLGYFLNRFSNIQSGQWMWSFFVHAQPLMLIYSWANEIFPVGWQGAGILLMQATALALPVGWIYHRFGGLPAVAFFLYFPLWYNAFFDFHMDHLAVPLLFGFFFMEKTGRILPAVMLAILLALVKEPFALQTAGCGLYLTLIRKHYVAGIALTVFGLSSFVFSTQYLVPFFSFGYGGSVDSLAFSWLGNSLTDMIWFIVTKPHIVLGEIFSDSGKIRYLIYIFGALGFISLLRPGILIVALPIMAIALLSKVGNHSGLFYHYTAGLIAPLIVAFAEGLPTARKFWSRLNFTKASFTPLLVVCFLSIHIKMAPSPISYVFWNKDSWAYSYQAYIPTHRDKMIKEAIRIHVPSDPEVAVSAQNNLNWGYLARRHNYFVFPMGVLEPYDVLQGSGPTLAEFINFVKTGKRVPIETEKKWADLVVLDLKRQWFLMDRGCSWKNDQCINDEEFSSEFLAVVQQTKERFDTVFEKDGFSILKRKRL